MVIDLVALSCTRLNVKAVSAKANHTGKTAVSVGEVCAPENQERLKPLCRAERR
jgi:hypothetical protein